MVNGYWVYNKVNEKEIKWLLFLKIIHFGVAKCGER